MHLAGTTLGEHQSSARSSTPPTPKRGAYGRNFKSEIEAARFAPCAEPTPPARQVGEIVESWLKEHQPSAAYVKPHPFGAGAVSIMHVWLGPDKDAGVIVVAAPRTDFPSENETLLLHVAANQAVIALQRVEARAERTGTEPVRSRPRPKAVSRSTTNSARCLAARAATCCK